MGSPWARALPVFSGRRSARGYACRVFLPGVVIALGIAVLQAHVPNPVYGCGTTYSGLTGPIATAKLTGEVSQVRFGGRTSPGALVAILVNDTLLDIGFASAIGKFDIVLDLAAIHDSLSSAVDSWETGGVVVADSLEFTLFAQDRLRLQTKRVNVFAQVGPDGLSAYDISLMPPTLKVFTPAIDLNGGITLAGFAVPASDVVVTIRDSEQEHIVVTGLDGFWSVWLPGPGRSATTRLRHSTGTHMGGKAVQPRLRSSRSS